LALIQVYLFALVHVGAWAWRIRRFFVFPPRHRETLSLLLRDSMPIQVIICSRCWCLCLSSVEEWVLSTVTCIKLGRWCSIFICVLIRVLVVAWARIIILNRFILVSKSHFLLRLVCPVNHCVILGTWVLFSRFRSKVIRSFLN